MSKRALILGVGGQDGSYLAELLLDKGYEVHGLHRRSSCDNLWRVRHLVESSEEHLKECGTAYRGCDPWCPKDQRERFHLRRGDLCDGASIDRAVYEVMPDEVYNLADQDHIDWSLVTPAYSYDVTFGAVGRLLESVNRINHCPQAGKQIRVFQPVSATVFGGPPPQAEDAPLEPISPYACAKAGAWHLCKFYRQAYGMYVACGVLFNHDSPRRQGDYLLHRIAAGIKKGQREFTFWDADQRVDIGFAGEYVDAMWRTLQQERPDDYCIGTGVGASIRELVCNGCGRWSTAVGSSQEGSRPGPAVTLIADTRKAERVLGWKATTGAYGVLGMLLEPKEGE